MSEIPDVVPGATIDTAWGNPIKDRTVMRYSNAAARDASIPVPVSGDVAWLDSTDDLTIYSGASWIEYVNVFDANADYLQVDGGNPMAADLNMAGNGIVSVETVVTEIVNGPVVRVYSSVTANTITLDVQGSALVNQLTILPVDLRPATGAVRWTSPIFTAGFGAKADEYATMVLSQTGTLNVAATSAGAISGDQVLSTFSYVTGARGL